MTAAQGLEILVDARLHKSRGGTPQIGKAGAEQREQERGQLSKGCHLLCSEQARTPGELHQFQPPVQMGCGASRSCDDEEVPGLCSQGESWRLVEPGWEKVEGWSEHSWVCCPQQGLQQESWAVLGQALQPPSLES